MNFLAHLHLAHLAESSLSGNLLADFVRGNPEESFPPDVVAGIHMHRVMTILPDSPPRFINLNNYLWSEQWLVRYRDMDFIQNVLNGMASRRPRLDALRDSWYDLDAHYDALETRFWQFYPRMMAQASHKAL